MSLLLNGDCLEQMKEIDDSSIDFIFCDLPYGQTSCSWDVIIPWEPFWKEIMRVKKLNTPIFMTTTTKFGVQIINSAPKKCPFRYDLVWVKSAPAGFLLAKKMPMRKHEMVYCFYEKLPFYDLSSHKHKFIKEVKQIIKGENNTYNTEGRKKPIVREKAGKYDPALPVSVVKEDKYCDEIINNNIIKDTKHGTNIYNTETGRNKPLKHTGSGAFGGQGACYDPALPVSVVKEDVYNSKERFKNGKLKKHARNLQKGDDPIYDPPLPVSVVKEANMGECYGSDKRDLSVYDDCGSKGKNQVLYDPALPVSVVKEEYNTKEGIIYNGGKPLPINDYSSKGRKGSESAYDPALPVSVVKEETDEEYIQPTTYGKNSSKKYNEGFAEKKGYNKNQVLYDPPLPNTIVKEATMINGTLGGAYDSRWQKGHQGNSYDPPLPNTMLEIKSTRGKHSTEKPVALMEWLLKYFSKEGDTVLDPTMGSGSTGVACKNMNRNFIGIEKDEEIFEVAVNRIEN